MLGKISNTNLGPASGSMPKENTTGNIIMPERMATRVSNTATMVAFFASESLSLKYDA